MGPVLLIAESACCHSFLSRRLRTPRPLNGGRPHDQGRNLRTSSLLYAAEGNTLRIFCRWRIRPRRSR
jgi:hypothetical protein